MSDPALAGLLADILAHPEQDAPRLIYADRLDEVAGEATARGEFIRVQVELATPLDVVRADVLRRRERELNDSIFDLSDNLPGVFTGGGPNLIIKYGEGGSGINYTFRRGFVEAIRLSASDWLAHADALLARQPVREVTLTTWPTGHDGIDVTDSWDALIAGKRVCPELPAGADIHMQLEWQTRGLRNADYTKALLSARWRGIDFTLPRGEDMTSINALLEEIRDQSVSPSP